jgi:MoxR-like ATPase
MRFIKNYEEFLNEGKLTDSIKNAIKWLGSFFKGKGSKFLNAMLAQSKGLLPKGVKIHPTEEDKALFKELKGKGNDSEKTKPSPKEEVEEKSNESIDWSSYFLGEALVKLDHPNSNVLNVGDEDLYKIIDRTFKSKDPLMIWGAPGIGKTSIVNAVTKAHGARIIEAPLTTMAPEDFFLPAISGEGAHQKAVDLPKEWLPVYHNSLGAEGDKEANGPDGKGGILFMDEINRARTEVQDVCLKLVLERRVGQYVLGSAWAVIAAGNREGDDNASTMAFSKILGNRFTQVNYSPTVTDWKQWALKAKDKDNKFIVDPEVLEFISWADKWFYALDNEDESPVWASPRSWTKASQQYIQAKMEAEKAGENLSNEEAEKIIASNVGKVAAREFIAFLKLRRKISLEDMKLVWTDPDKAPLPPKGQSDGYEPDSTYALLGAIVFAKRDDKITEPEFKNLLKYSIKLKQAAWAVKLMSALTTIHPYLKTDEKFLTAMNDFADAYPAYNQTKK